MNHKGHRERSPLAYAILSYLASHPDAQDTLEGIVHWWILEQEIKHWTTEVDAALTDLVAEGLVIKEQGLDGRNHYRLNQRLAEELGLLLKGRPAPESDEPVR